MDALTPEKAPTPELILEAAYCLYSCPEDGLSDTDAAAVSAILKAKVKQARQIFSLCLILKPYQAKLAGLGYEWNVLVAPQPFTGPQTSPDEIVLGPTVSMKRVESKGEQMVALSVPYDPKLVDLIKTLKSRRWDKDEKVWLIPYSAIDVEMAIATFKAEKVVLELDPSLKGLIEVGKRSYQESRAESANIEIPTKIQLYPFQKAGVKWVDDHDGRAFITDEMGLGKTASALGWLCLRHEKALPALVLCPSLVRVGWYREVLNFTHLKPLLISGKTALPGFRKAGLDVSDQPLPGYDVVITNYDLLSVETPQTWLRMLLKKNKDHEKHAERHLALAGLQAKELLVKAMTKYKDIDSRNRISRVLGMIENQGDKARKEKAAEYKLVSVNGVYFDEFVKAGFQTLICDESHFIKETDAQRSIASLEISRSVKYSICLTGTPIDNRPRELWNQIMVVNPTIFPKFFDYGRRYCAAFQKPAAGGRMVWDFSGVSNIAELEKVLRSTIMIRRTKDQVMKELPPKTRTMIPFMASEDEEKGYRKEESAAIERLRAIRKERKEWKALIDSLPEADRRAYIAKHAEKAAHNSALAEIAINEIEKLKSAAVDAKFSESAKFVLGLKETQGKILVFAIHHATIDRLVAAFKAQNIKTNFIDGRITGQDRQDVIDSFQKGDLDILVCGIRAASVGITLTASHTVVFIELDWTPGIHAQAEDRTYRIGQSKPVTVYYLLLLGSIEEKIAKMIDAKRQMVNSIMGEGDRTIQEAGILDAVLDELLQAA